jgi:tRNA(fMet)-specific endonuclease VapC
MATAPSIRCLLATNICIYIAKGQPLAVRKRFDLHTVNELSMSTITIGELRFGTEKSQSRDRAMATIEQLEQLIQPSWLPKAAGSLVRALLQKQGTPIGNNDLWLAAHALAEDWILLTNNTRGFDRVPGLRMESWVE